MSSVCVCFFVRAVRGKQLTIIVRCPAAAHGQNIEDVEISTHSNEVVAAVRRKIVTKLVDVISLLWQVSLSLFSLYFSVQFAVSRGCILLVLSLVSGSKFFFTPCESLLRDSMFMPTVCVLFMNWKHSSLSLVPNFPLPMVCRVCFFSVGQVEGSQRGVSGGFIHWCWHSDFCRW